MLTALGLRGFVMQIYTGSGVGCVEGVRLGEGVVCAGAVTRPEFRSQQLPNI